ncbi:ATP-binding protein [Nocardioides guangzhouensis]|uniref:ATP-binding protein n=1 Tax=Nocardioides guangzhouensis TaxID=2497878 RepID=A0A4Q4ZF34_9ACTN|nr:ATP-binding protein [Nocardioides guangzhouensis]
MRRRADVLGPLVELSNPEQLVSRGEWRVWRGGRGDPGLVEGWRPEPERGRVAVRMRARTVDADALVVGPHGRRRAGERGQDECCSSSGDGSRGLGRAVHGLRLPSGVRWGHSPVQRREGVSHVGGIPHRNASARTGSPSSAVVAPVCHAERIPGKGDGAMDRFGGAAERSLVGRGFERRELDDLPVALAGGPAALLLLGDAGIGKTSLWAYGIQAAEAAAQVLVARPSELDLRAAFSGLTDLLRGREEDIANLPGLARTALNRAVGLDAGDASMDQVAVAMAAADLLDDLSAERPVLLAVDDLPWLDPATARVIGYALRRLRDRPVGLLACQRGHAVSDMVRYAVPPERVWTLDLSGLTVDEMTELVRRKLGVVFLRPMTARVHAASGGNPFYALELARHVLLQPDPVPGRGRLPLPPTLSDLVGRRLASVPAATREVLLGQRPHSRPRSPYSKQSPAHGPRRPCNVGSTPASSCSTAARSGSATRCLPRPRTPRPTRRGGVVFTSRWPRWPTASRSVPRTCTPARRSPTSRWLPSWRRQPSTPARGALRRPPRTSSPPPATSRRTATPTGAVGASSPGRTSACWPGRAIEQSKSSAASQSSRSRARSGVGCCC